MEEQQDPSANLSDSSGNNLAALREKLLLTRRQQIVEMVMRQTDYSAEMAVEKLEKWQYNYLSVIKEYMNPEFSERTKETDSAPKSTNQKIMGEIRGFMDNVNRQYKHRKKVAENENLRRQLMALAAARAASETENKKIS